MRCSCLLAVAVWVFLGLVMPLANAEFKSVKVDPSGKLLVNGEPARLWGVRTVCAAARDDAANQLIENLKEYKEAGVNLLVVCYQGGPGLTLKTFSADGTSFEDTAARDRMRKIIDAAARQDVFVMVSLFFPRKMGVGGQDPKLASRDAYLAACKTAAEELKTRNNVILSVCDQALPTAFGMSPMKFTSQDIIECLKAVSSVAPELLRGGGNNHHETNVAIANSDAATVILHAENGVNPPTFTAKKPIIHVAFAGNESAGRNPQGFYHPAARQPFTDILDRYVDASTAHFIVHLPAWYEGGADLKTNRFDLGGAGTIKEPGVRWYFDMLEKRARRRPAQIADKPGPGGDGGQSIFDFPNGPKKK